MKYLHSYQQGFWNLALQSSRPQSHGVVTSSNVDKAPRQGAARRRPPRCSDDVTWAAVAFSLLPSFWNNVTHCDSPNIVHRHVVLQLGSRAVDDLREGLVRPLSELILPRLAQAENVLPITGFTAKTGVKVSANIAVGRGLHRSEDRPARCNGGSRESVRRDMV